MFNNFVMVSEFNASDTKVTIVISTTFSIIDALFSFLLSVYSRDEAASLSMK